MTIADKEVIIYPALNPDAPLVILNAYEGEGEAVHTELQKQKIPDLSFAAAKIPNWNTDMSPWAIPPVYKNDEPFTGGADEYLGKLTNDIVPAVISDIGGKPAYIALAGYSLYSLFLVRSWHLKTSRRFPMVQDLWLCFLTFVAIYDIITQTITQEDISHAKSSCQKQSKCNVRSFQRANGAQPPLSYGTRYNGTFTEFLY